MRGWGSCLAGGGPAAVQQEGQQPESPWKKVWTDPIQRLGWQQLVEKALSCHPESPYAEGGGGSLVVKEKDIFRMVAPDLEEKYWGVNMASHQQPSCMSAQSPPFPQLAAFLFSQPKCPHSLHPHPPWAILIYSAFRGPVAPTDGLLPPASHVESVSEPAAGRHPGRRRPASHPVSQESHHY